jgi:hypothetical protein
MRPQFFDEFPRRFRLCFQPKLATVRHDRDASGISALQYIVRSAHNLRSQLASKVRVPRVACSPPSVLEPPLRLFLPLA